MVPGYKINPADKHLVEEFRAKPIGLHSPALQSILNVFRGAPIDGKYVLICTKPPFKIFYQLLNEDVSVLILNITNTQQSFT